MLKQISRFKEVLVILLILAMLTPGAYARDDNRGHDRGGSKGYSRSDNRGHSGGSRHYYRDGRWYRRGWFGFEFIVSALAVGALINSLPPTHSTVVVEGNSYYHDDRYYYRQRPDGYYVVVPPPVIVPAQVIVQPPPQYQESSTINIPNSRGGYTSVTLRRSGNGFIGPQGEYYPDFPSVEQLRTMYGN